ncbi:MAG: hypothetical protein ABH967_00750 [Patescibacteria group bacterium]
MLEIMSVLKGLVTIFILISSIITIAPQTEKVLDTPTQEIQKTVIIDKAKPKKGLIESITDLFSPFFNFSDTSPQQENNYSSSNSSSSNSSSSSSSSETTKQIEQKITGKIDTFFVSGPKEGEVIEETNEVTFEFEGKLLDSNDEIKITFETKILNIDDDWKSTSRNERTIILPNGPKEYTFLVRAKTEDLIDQTPIQRKFKINTSPYFGKVEISSIKTQSSSPSLIVLTSELSGNEKINIANWQIKSKVKSSTIPGATEKYYPNQDASPGSSLYISRNHKIYISGGFNPLGSNRNFRVNKCMGYLENYNDFPIDISTSCPKPTSEEIDYLSACCQKFIKNSSKCALPDYSNDESVMFDNECTTYIQNYFNYATCFNQYQKDNDFLEDSWHIYLNSSNLLTNNTCDTLYLRDSNGLFVDKESYGTLKCN